MKQRAVFLAGCIFPFLLSILSCDDGMALRDYVNDYVIPATFATVEVADAAEWEGAGNTGLSGLVAKLRSLSRERGRAAVTPGSEREAGEPSYTVLKITLNNERDTAYEPLFEGTDASLVSVRRSAGPSVFYITLDAVNLDPMEEARTLDITLKLKAPPAHKPPGLIALPIECAYSSGRGGSLTVAPGRASVARGTVQQFYAVSPELGDISVTWTLEGSLAGSSIGTESGLLTVAAGEDVGRLLTVKASAAGFLAGTAAVTVIDKKATITADGGVIGPDGVEEFVVERGQGKRFTASSEAGDSWTWSVTGAGGTSWIDDGGYLSVKEDETAMLLTVTAILRANPQISGAVVVKIPTVTGVMVSPGEANVDRGASLSFSAVVTGFALGDSDDVTWSVQGGGMGTTISQTGELIVASGETALSLTVTATSVYNNPAKSGTVVVSVGSVASITRNGSTSYYAALQEAVTDATGGTPASPVTITLLKDVTITSGTAITLDGSRHIKLVPNSTKRTITRGASGFGGSLFTVQSGASLTLEGNGTSKLVIDGGAVWSDPEAPAQGAELVKSSGPSATGPLVKVNGGTLTIKKGAVLQNNYNNSSDTSRTNGGGVSVKNGYFTLAGGTIRNNYTYTDGGGVNIENTVFTMTGGLISNNYMATSWANGGGVYSVNSSITFSGGEISGNYTAFDSANSGNNRTGGGISLGGGSLAISGTAAIKNNTGYNGGGVSLTKGTYFGMTGGTISGNTAKGSGGGVFVNGEAQSGTSFTMSGGAISGNTATSGSGGGVYVVSGGVFTMTGGAMISGNTATSGSGGGVYVVSGGAFIMAGGAISGNNATGSADEGGGGVYVTGNDSTFTMSSGAISKNTADQNGGGVYVFSNGAFTMTGGTISRNTVLTPHSGGGVYVFSGGTFTMTGGAIGENKAGDYGGGVYVGSTGTFAMSGGTVSGNTASYHGGGVYVGSTGTFAMSGGTVSGNTVDHHQGGGGGVYNSGEFTMSGSAVVDQDNDVYLYNYNGKVITVGALTGSGLVAKITPQNTAEGAAVLKAAVGTTLTNDKIKRFTLKSGIEMAIGLNDEGEGVLKTPAAAVALPDGSTIYADTLQAAIAAATGGTADTPVIISLRNNVTISLSSETITLASGKHVKLVPEGADKTISRGASGFGSLFTVPSNASLTLEGDGDNELIIDGGKDNGITASAALVRVNDGKLTMNAGVTLKNNNNGVYGGGVYVDGGGEFMMAGGEISGNTAYSGGGVYVRNTSSFTMTGGEISGNKATSSGGGVCVDSSFTMAGGAVISGNTAPNGGGISVSGISEFKMEGGEVSGNTATAGLGGGVYLSYGGAFTMTDGAVSGNRATGSGGGVYVIQAYGASSGTRSKFTMSGGAISKNEAANGGGVGVGSYGVFNKTGGTVYGSNDGTNANTAASSGAALHNSGGTVTVNEADKGTTDDTF